MAAQLKGTVYVTDPDTHQTVELAPGTSPEPHLAALVTNPAAWVDGKLPRLPKTKTDTGSGSDQDDASGDDSDTSAATEPSEGYGSEDTKPAAKKTAARKTAASKTAAN
ncbi:hypothetical protein [[Kitasatospora] papulosa]|uniref:hypothetical protein n=1 Tax=[Kitasatospora] papulosa TaxID=1464011 RepID=UPI0036294D87